MPTDPAPLTAAELVALDEQWAELTSDRIRTAVMTGSADARRTQLRLHLVHAFPRLRATIRGQEAMRERCATAIEDHLRLLRLGDRSEPGRAEAIRCLEAAVEGMRALPVDDDADK